jgi:Carbonic anhydrases/acetyltransferases, isoleucine patch superfamily
MPMEPMIYALGQRQPDIAADAWVAPGAVLIGAVTLQAASSVWFGCVLRGDEDEIRVGAGSNVQDGAVLHTDRGLRLEIGARVTVGHQAMLHGCRIGDGCLIGIGARVLNGASIGAGSLVGAGALVPEGKSFPPGVLLLGAPARVARELGAPEQALLRAAADHYIANAQRFRTELRRV